ncbi:MAG: hypothetical protein A3H35_14360 [Betaproteobacteria bacterium RIFCSPLOWO2_02_FULL_62_17]|nr:MAG: hypothetical protein A3H35_14360 [Betaproteobacteria bacterium RIFCSPLOWO2_02_FULL_62_17]
MHAVSLDEVAQDKSLVAGAAPSPAADPALQAKAEQFVDALLSLDPADIRARQDGKSAIENMGLELQRRAAQKSQMLKQPIKKLTERTQEGGDVGNALIDLKMKVEEIDPGEVDFESGWFTRLIGQLPGVGSPLKRYFTRYESAQTVIQAIMRSLEQGRDGLMRDNLTLADDQTGMRELTKKLEQAIRLGQAIDARLEARMQAMQQGSDQHSFVAEELLFPLRQRLMDLQQQLAVNQQGILATELIIRNNKELVRGVNRALNVTLSALQVGATVAIALANQRDVIEKVDSVNKTTNDLITGTAERLRTQGAQIHKQAASAQLDIEGLKSAFVNIRAAMEDIATFRQNALPKMAQSVLELDRLSSDADETIRKLERGNQARPRLNIDVE